MAVKLPEGPWIMRVCASANAPFQLRPDEEGARPPLTGREGGAPAGFASGGACPSAPSGLSERKMWIFKHAARLPDSGAGGNRRLLCHAPRPKDRTRLIFGTNTTKRKINGTEDSGGQQQIELTHQRTHPPRRPPPRRSYVLKRRLVADPAGSPVRRLTGSASSRIQPEKKGATYEILHSPQKFKSVACFFPWR